MPKYQQLSARALSRGMATLAFLMWLVGVTWHGILGNPSLITYMYPWFSYSNPVHAVGLLIIWMVAFFLIGYLVATFYNWNLKKR